MATKPTIIYMVRHGESEFNRDGLVSGHSNPALTENGIKQAHGTKKTLSGVSFHEVYSSDLDRAIITAEIVSGKRVHPDNRLKTLREKYYGTLEAMSTQELDGDAKNRLKLPKTESWEYKHVENMESDKELADRLLNQIEEIAKKHEGQTILIGSHGTAIRVILMKLQDKHYNEMPSGKFRNGGHIKLIYENGNFKIDEIDGYN